MRVAEILKDWTADDDLVKVDLAKPEKYLAHKRKDGHCLLPETSRSSARF